MTHIGDNVQKLIGTRMATKLFHASATARKKVNRINSHDDDDAGNKITNEQGFCDVARQYFMNIFHKQGGVFSPVLDAIQSFVSTIYNDKLTAPFTKAEFRSAIFFMHPDKCAGPDGYSPGFYQHFWNLCSDDC